VGLYGTAGALEITDVEQSSGYPVRFEVQGGAWGDDAGPRRSVREEVAELSHQPYLQGEHLSLGEPHVYVDIMDLVDAIRDGRPPRATGELARLVVEVIEKAHVAARTGQTQALTSTFVPASQG
jgi:predicted dehydrogenase